MTAAASAFDSNNQLAAMRDELATEKYHLNIKSMVMTAVGGVLGAAAGAGIAIATLGIGSAAIPAAIAIGAMGGSSLATMPLQVQQEKLATNQKILDNAVDSTKQNNYHVDNQTTNGSMPLAIVPPSTPNLRDGVARAA